MYRCRLRTVVSIALAVLALDWSAAAAFRIRSPVTVVAHVTSPRPAAVVVLLVGIGLLVWLFDDRVLVLALGVCLGGAGANLLERLFGGAVSDFIALPPVLWVPGATWNLADLAILVSMPLLMIAAAHQITRLKPSSGHSEAARVPWRPSARPNAG